MNNDTGLVQEYPVDNVLLGNNKRAVSSRISFSLSESSEKDLEIDFERIRSLRQLRMLLAPKYDVVSLKEAPYLTKVSVSN